MFKVIEGFHNRVAIRIEGVTVRRVTSGEWEWPPVAEVLEISGLWTIKEYIHLRQATVAAQVDCWIIYELCTGAERIPGTNKFMWCWYKDVGREVE